MPVAKTQPVVVVIEGKQYVQMGDKFVPVDTSGVGKAFKPYVKQDTYTNDKGKEQDTIRIVLSENGFMKISHTVKTWKTILEHIEEIRTICKATK